MTTAEKLFEELAKQAATLGRRLTRTEWITFVDRALEELAPKKKKKRPAIGINKMTEEEFVKYLEAEPVIVEAGVDVKKEIGKCQFYWRGKSKVPSRQRVVNWLLRCADRPVSGSYDGASSVTKTAAFKRKDPPHGWREFMKQKIRNWEETFPNGGDAPGKSALELYDDFYRMPTSWQGQAWKELGP